MSPCRSAKWQMPRTRHWLQLSNDYWWKTVIAHKHFSSSGDARINHRSCILCMTGVSGDFRHKFDGTNVDHCTSCNLPSSSAPSSLASSSSSQLSRWTLWAPMKSAASAPLFFLHTALKTKGGIGIWCFFFFFFADVGMAAGNLLRQLTGMSTCQKVELGIQRVRCTAKRKKKKRWNISFGSTVPFEVPVREVCCKTNTHLVHTNCTTFFNHRHVCSISPSVCCHPRLQMSRVRRTLLWFPCLLLVLLLLLLLL